MRIAQVSTLATPVGPGRVGSVEGLVWLLARELTARGHEVTLFAAGGSDASPARLVETTSAPYTWEGGPEDWQLAEWINLCAAVARSREFDVLHTHAYLWGLPLAPLSSARMVATTHVMPSRDAAALRRTHPEACVTAISRYQWSAHPGLAAVPVIPHGLDTEALRPVEEPGEHLLWMGRFAAYKGPLDAIRVARAVGRRLVLAGPRNRYYDEVVAPHVDGEHVSYVGYVGGEERTRVLARAGALIYPVGAPEPFGLVLAEAMLCGTPVAALALGAVPEVVDEGVTGATAEDVDGLAEAVSLALEVPRAGVRRRAVERFSVQRMTDDYLRVYETVTA